MQLTGDIRKIKNELRQKYREYRSSLSAQEKDAMIVGQQTLDALVLSAHENKCRICGEDTCAGCPLCKALDNVLAFDRDGRSWATINIGEVM